MVISHEQAHIRRLDHWYKLLGFITLCVHWFNPLVWLAYIFLCRDMEMACDEQVVKDMDTTLRKAYYMALLRCSADSHHFKPCPVAFAEVSVKDRIKGVLNYKKPGFWMTLVGIVAVVFVSVCFLTSPASSDDQPPEEVEDLLVAYLDAMKEDVEEAASYHYFADTAIETIYKGIYKGSRDSLTAYEILSWEKMAHGIWVAQVNLKMLSQDDWEIYHQFIGKIDGQYRVVYYYDVDETDDFSQGIDLSPYLDLNPNTLIYPLEAYSDEDLRQHCISLMKLLRKGEYHYLSYTVAHSDPDMLDFYIQQIETPDFFFLEEILYEKQSGDPHHQSACMFAQSGTECYERILHNPSDGWVRKESEEMRRTKNIPEFLNDHPAVFESYPMRVNRFETGIWCTFDVTDGSNGVKSIEFRFDENDTLASIVIQSSSTYGETTRTYENLWLTEAEIQQLADDLLEEARKAVDSQLRRSQNRKRACPESGAGSNSLLSLNYAFSRARVRVVRSQTSLGPQYWMAPG